MTVFIVPWCLGLFAALIVFGGRAAADVSVEIGRSLFVVSDVEGQFGDAPPKRIAINDDIVFGEDITTGADAKTAIEFRDGSTLEVGPGSAVRIDSFVFNPEETISRKALHVGSGVFRYVSAFTTADQSTQIQTPGGTLAIRGSVISGIVDTETPDEVALLTDVYADLKRKLAARGMPAHEIRFVHEAKTREARFRLFQAANDGLARIIIGSTAKLGTGVNVQKRLAALHHLDAPWRPMDLEQRDGRGIRQGNEVYGPVFDTAGTLIDPGQGIRIFLYVTAHSFDGYGWVRHVSPKSRELAYAG